MKVKIFLLILMLFQTILFSSQKLLIKIPTRSRPQQFFSYLDQYYEYLSGEVDCVFIISCDTDDMSMNNDEIKARLVQYKNLYCYFSDNKSKIEACNKDIDKHMDFDVLLLASDDMIPVVRGYDKIIMDYMRSSFPDFDGVLNFFDGIYGEMLNSMPIMGKKYYQRFGYIYHPDYKSWWCDCELTIIAKLLNREKVINEVIIKHMQLELWKNDELYQKNMKYVEQDKALFSARVQRKFDLNRVFLNQLNSSQLSLFNLYHGW